MFAGTAFRYLSALTNDFSTIEICIYLEIGMQRSLLHAFILYR